MDARQGSVSYFSLLPRDVRLILGELHCHASVLPLYDTLMWDVLGGGFNENTLRAELDAQKAVSAWLCR
jgi:hypothetical protein